MRQYVAPLTRSAAKGQKPCRTRSARFAPAAARSGCHRGELVDAEGDFACGENDGPTVCGRLRTVSRATSLVLEDALGRAMVAERRRFPGSAGTGGRPRCTRPAAPEPPGPGLHMPPDPRPVLRPRPCRTPRRGGGRGTRPGGVLPAADPVKAGRAGRGRRELEEGRRGPERAGGPEGPGPGRGERAGRAEGTGRAGRAAGDGDGGPGETLRRRASPAGSRGATTGMSRAGAVPPTHRSPRRTRRTAPWNSACAERPGRAGRVAARRRSAGRSTRTGEAQHGPHSGELPAGTYSAPPPFPPFSPFSTSAANLASRAS